MHRTDKRSEYAALIGLVAQIGFFGLFLFLFNLNKSPATLAAGWHLLAGVGIWILVFVELYQQRQVWQQRVELEEFEHKRLGRMGGSESVFQQVNPDDELPAERRMKLIKRWFVPVFSIVTACLLLLFAVLLVPTWRPMQWVLDAFESGLENQFATLVIAAVVSLCCFVISRYALGLSRMSEWRALRAGANYIVGNALVCFALAIVLALSVYGVTIPERILAQAIPFVMIVLAAEILINLVLDIYRPRIPGEEYRPSYESRLLGLFSEPEGVLSSIAQTIDYQFGFKVSETWFYKLLQEAIAPLLLFSIVTLYLMSTIVIVQPGHQAVVTRFGQRPESPLKEGLHFKWPWPIEKAKVYSVGLVNQTSIGYTGDSAWFNPDHDEPILWTVKHVTGQEFQILIASKHFAEDQGDSNEFTDPLSLAEQDHKESQLTPVNILVGNLVIYYNIKDEDRGGLLDYISQYEKPEVILEAVAYRQFTKYMASVDPMAVMTTDRSRLTSTLTRQVQEELDRLDTGIEVMKIGMIGMHPPLEIADAFEAAINARQERETMIWSARGDANERLPAARAFEGEVLSRAAGDRYEKVILEQARAERFAGQLESYRISPEVFYLRNYLDVLTEATVGVRKFILAVEHPEKVLFYVDDKEKISSGIMGLGEEISEDLRNQPR